MPEPIGSEELVVENDVDIVLLDIIIPIMNGTEVYNSAESSSCPCNATS